MSSGRIARPNRSWRLHQRVPIVAASSYPDRRWISHWCRAGDDIVRKPTGTRIQKTSRKQRLPYRPAERS